MYRNGTTLVYRQLPNASPAGADLQRNGQSCRIVKTLTLDDIPDGFDYVRELLYDCDPNCEDDILYEIAFEDDLRTLAFHVELTDPSAPTGKREKLLKNVEDRVYELYFRYGCKTQTRQQAALVAVCMDELDRHPDLAAELTDHQSMLYFIEQMALENVHGKEYVEAIFLPREKLDACNELLNLPSAEDALEKAGYPRYSVIESFGTTFINGYTAEVKIHSTDEDFSGEVVLFDSEGMEVTGCDADAPLEGEYVLSGYDGTTYRLLVKATEK